MADQISRLLDIDIILHPVKFFKCLISIRLFWKASLSQTKPWILETDYLFHR